MHALTAFLRRITWPTKGWKKCTQNKPTPLTTIATSELVEWRDVARRSHDNKRHAHKGPACADYVYAMQHIENLQPTAATAATSKGMKRVKRL